MGGGHQKGNNDTRVTGSKTWQMEAMLCAHIDLTKKTQENKRNSHVTLELQHVEATSGASRAASGTAETLAAHGGGEERRGMRRHAAQRTKKRPPHRPCYSLPSVS
jgi:hypothetical protein